jgi:hypothetical protein
MCYGCLPSIFTLSILCVLALLGVESHTEEVVFQQIPPLLNRFDLEGKEARTPLLFQNQTALEVRKRSRITSL